jgi:hypothetical protein
MFKFLVEYSTDRESKDILETEQVEKLLGFLNDHLDSLSSAEIEQLLKRKHFQTSFFAIACSLQLKPIVQFVIKKCLEVLNHGKPNPFWLAVSTGNTNIVRLLSEVQDIDFNTAAPDGTTPLTIA